MHLEITILSDNTSTELLYATIVTSQSQSVGDGAIFLYPKFVKNI